MTQERISELKDKSIEIIPPEEQKKNVWGEGRGEERGGGRGETRMKSQESVGQ